MSVLEAAQTGDEVATLEALRDRLAATIDDSSSGAVGQTAAQLLAVLRRLADLTPSGKVALSDALAERRVARASQSESEVVAGRGAKRAS